MTDPDPTELAFRFRPEPGDDRPVSVRVRQMLKLALRVCGLRLVGYLGPAEIEDTMRDIATTKSGHIRGLLHLIEDMQEAFKVLERLNPIPAPADLLGAELRVAQERHRQAIQAADTVRAGLDRLREEL